MYPHERSLVKRFQGQPFVLLAVDTGNDADRLRKLVRDGDVTWRSWWDGDDSAIVRQWNVEAFPTIYLIDAKGVIREKFLGSPGEHRLDAAIEKLIAEK